MFFNDSIVLARQIDISQYHYVIQILYICDQESDMTHKDQDQQRRGGAERRLLICKHI